MDGGAKSPEILFRVLFDRCKSLEFSQQNLKQQFDVVLQEKTSYVKEEKEVTLDSNDGTSLPGWAEHIPGTFFLGSPYRNVLENMGHAVHLSRIGSWEIIYWNRAAENLFGYKDHEVVGQRTIELIFDEEHHHSALAIMQRLSSGRSWAGQLSLKKRSGQSFMALVTKSPLYEDGELVGIVTVSSDAAVFNNTNSGNVKTIHEPSKFSKTNLNKIQWHSRAPTSAGQQFASSVSNLASRVLQRKRGDVTCEEAEADSFDVKADRPPRVPILKPAFSFSIGRSRTETMSLEKEESASEFARPSKTGVKFFQKLHIGLISNLEKVEEENIERNGNENSCACQACSEPHRPAGQFPRSNLQSDGSKSMRNVTNTKSLKSGDVPPGTLSSKGDQASHVVINSEIQWEDLQLREEIGQGSFAVVYRGLWNGSDVAVKVYGGNQYSEETLRDSRKEIDIMRRLRHPNVLLFMGAVFSEERIAMVTEYMTKGSLFKTLHKCNQSLDMRRRLRMAIDVARGMNYLHHRNPPIVHRDLKSSNLLVDKSLNVKVGDFGLSKLKYATFLTARSGRGTPQWMAPEVLRNEPSTEKSDVFSFGVILWELMTESIPWSNLNSLQVVGVVGFMDRRLDLPENIDPQISSIISECWQSNPEYRPSFERIIQKMAYLVNEGVGTTARTASMP